MQFLSIRFLLFTALLLPVYYSIPGSAQWAFLLAASICFYLHAGTASLVFLLVTALHTYFCALRISRNQAIHAQQPPGKRSPDIKRKNRFWLILCLSVNFSVLFLCKSCLIEPFRTALSRGRLSFLSLGLPLGISFYLFQSAGYCIDVYRGTVAAQRNFGKFALFVTYFPQLLQGPISRFSQLAPQFFSAHRYDGKQVSFGLQRMLWGYFKKLVIADRIAIAVSALKAPEYTGASFLVLSLFYALQIYGDFTGGMDIALGLSQALGIHLPENFSRPFFSRNVAMYWRRWHITLGTWMKDYLFYPLCLSRPLRKFTRFSRQKLGSLGKRLPVYAASVITWFATGIWHGLTPNFVMWGMLNCLVIVVSEELSPLYRRFHSRFSLRGQRWYSGFEILRTFFLMNLIRACDLFPDVGDYLRRVGSVFTAPRLHVLWDGSLLSLGLSTLDYGILAAGTSALLLVSLFQAKHGSIRECLWRKNAAFRYALNVFLLLTVLLAGNYGVGYQASNFIYNQF